MSRTVTDKQVERMYNLFKGLKYGYGVYDMSAAYYEGKKLRGQPKSITEDSAGRKFDKAFWLGKVKQHLTTEEGLGIVPVNEDSECIWGCIDIDKYDLNYQEILLRIKKYGLPLIATVSKSGGLHLWCLSKTPVKAYIMMNYLKNIKARLGFADAEVFPKQTKVLYEAGDSGSWINIPMAGNGTRYGIKLVDDEVVEIKDLEDFLNYAESSRIDKLKSADVEFKKSKNIMPQEYSDFPYCLQVMLTDGFPEGTRNITLWNLGVALKKAYPENWKTQIERYNQAYCEPALGADEVVTIQKSLDKDKDYFYQCNIPPLSSYCNPVKCKQCKYGAGDCACGIFIESLSKIDTTPATWFASIGDSRLSLTTDELIDQKSFQKKCLEQLNRMPPRLKDKEWQIMIDKLVQDAVLIPAAPDAGDEGTFDYLLDEYCSTMGSPSQQDLLRKRAWLDTEHGLAYLSLTDFMLFLKKNKFDKLIKSQVSAKLRDMGGGHKFFNILGRGINTHYVPIPELQSEKFSIKEFESESLV